MHIGIRSQRGRHFCGGSEHDDGSCRYLTQYTISVTSSPINHPLDCLALAGHFGPLVHVVFGGLGSCH